MKGEKSEYEHTPPMPGERGQQHGYKNRPGNAMQQVVMVDLVAVERLGLIQFVADDVDNNAQPVQIRSNPCQRHQPAVARIVSGFRRHNPACEQMGDGRHARSGFGLHEIEKLFQRGGKLQSIIHRIIVVAGDFAKQLWLVCDGEIALGMVEGDE